MTAMLAHSITPLHGPLFQAGQQVTEAEERREQQISVLSAFAQDSPARIYAEHVLSEIERTIALSRMNQKLIESLLA
ncbi:hypothetical protein [Methylobacterium sp.]|uniref:hypothetical protein n=1 Tax=Methylobacterium sp. TaxID=409 RepID=UPI003B00D8B5